MTRREPTLGRYFSSTVVSLSHPCPGHCPLLGGARHTDVREDYCSGKTRPLWPAWLPNPPTGTSAFFASIRDQQTARVLPTCLAAVKTSPSKTNFPGTLPNVVLFISIPTKAPDLVRLLDWASDAPGRKRLALPHHLPSSGWPESNLWSLVRRLSLRADLAAATAIWQAAVAKELIT